MTATSPNPRRLAAVVVVATTVATTLHLHLATVPAWFVSIMSGVDPQIIWDAAPDLGHNNPLVVIAGVAVNGLLWLYAMYSRTENEN
jgi:hypothetical protein